jgi:hypothetical protein
LATLVVATVRGLVLDLLTTNDEDRAGNALAALTSVIVQSAEAGSGHK